MATVLKELTNKRTANAKHYRLENGKNLAILQKSLHYQKSDGTFGDVNTSLSYLGGEIEQAGEPVTHRCDTVLLPVAMNRYRQPLVIGSAEPIIIRPVGATNVEGYKVGNKITYTNVYSNIDIIREVTPEGLKNWAVVKGGGPRSFEFNVPQGLERLKKLYSPGYLQNPNDILDVRLCTVEWTSTGYIWHLPDLTGLDYPIMIDDSVTLQPDSAGFDTSLRQDNPTTNFGASTTSFYCGDANAPNVTNLLIKFDVSSITSSATLTTVQLSLYEKGAGGAGNRTFNLHRCLRAWGELTATWNTYDGSNNWGTAGCNNSTTDYDSDISAGLILDATPASDFVTWEDTTLLADYQGFVDGGLTNNGHVLRDPDQPASLRYNDFKSSDDSTAADRPKLYVEYSTFTPQIIMVL